MPEIMCTFDVGGVDPTLVDPEEVVGWILDTYNEMVRANGNYDEEVGQTCLEAEWTSQ